MDPRKKLVGVESVAVVWEVRESVYSSSSLLSSVRNLSGISLEEEVSFDVSPETSCLEASLGSVGVAGRGEDPFPVSSWGACGTPGSSLSSSSSSSGSGVSFPPVPLHA